MDTIFFTRLESLCSQNPVKDVSGLLKALDLSTSKGTAWRNGAIPKGDVLLKIASYFHVSTDYLLGNTDDPTPAGQKEGPPQGGEPIGPNKRALLDLVEDMSEDEMAALLELVKATKKMRGKEK